ncbi:MAG: beta-ketoacyl-[acyl-carrier-protein] synthase II [Dehalococcoidia bacterium]|nr:beta-ketoacyl-[acyl-carrier-protein] synthase II [Dehalococcoidia bacterium]
MGAITPLGLDVPSSWEGVLAGRSAVVPISTFDATEYPCRIAGEVKDFDPTDYIEAKDARRTDRFVQFSLVATQEALRDADLEVTEERADLTGVYIGTGIGGLHTLSEQMKVLDKRGVRRVSPFLVPMMIADMASGQVSIDVGARGPNMGIVSACASGAHAIGEAYEVIRRGDAEAMITGGTEGSITPIGLAGFCASRALTKQNEEPERASRPFDAKRDGFVPSEGAGIVILESLEHAQDRGAHIHAELVGYGATADAFHITLPAEEGAGARRAMAMALRKADLDVSDVDYINAHGTSTEANDRLETQAVKTLFGDYASRLPMSSTKSMIGHALGAAGGIEAIFSIKALQDDVLPPTINYEHPDPACDLNYVPNEARPAHVDVTMSNSFGFGGHNASLVFRAYAP